MKKLITLLCSVCLVGVFVLAGCSNSEVQFEEEPSTVEDVTTSQTEVTYTKTQMKPLYDNGIISGVESYSIEQDADVKVKDFVMVNSELITNVDVDDSSVDYHTPGIYDVIYRFTFDTKKVKTYETKKGIDLGLPKDFDFVVIKTQLKVNIIVPNSGTSEENVVSKGTADQIINRNLESITEHAETATTVAEIAQQQTTIAQEQTTQKQEQTTTAPAHQHKWVEKKIHHDAVYEQVQTGTKTVVDKAAWDEQVWVQDSGPWDEIVGYRVTVECTNCWATFVGEGATSEAAYDSANAQWRSHSFSVH